MFLLCSIGGDLNYFYFAACFVAYMITLDKRTHGNLSTSAKEEPQGRARFISAAGCCWVTSRPNSANELEMLSSSNGYMQQHVSPPPSHESVTHSRW
jgi:hypothetical protein